MMNSTYTLIYDSLGISLSTFLCSSCHLKNWQPAFSEKYTTQEINTWRKTANTVGPALELWKWALSLCKLITQQVYGASEIIKD